MAVKQYLSCKISGYSIYNAAYKILPEVNIAFNNSFKNNLNLNIQFYYLQQIISDVFAITISWDKGSGKNATTRSIHLKHQYPNFASMLKGEILNKCLTL